MAEEQKGSDGKERIRPEIVIPPVFLDPAQAVHSEINVDNSRFFKNLEKLFPENFGFLLMIAFFLTGVICVAKGLEERQNEIHEREIDDLIAVFHWFFERKVLMASHYHYLEKFEWAINFDINAMFVQKEIVLTERMLYIVPYIKPGCVCNLRILSHPAAQFIKLYGIHTDKYLRDFCKMVSEGINFLNEIFADSHQFKITDAEIYVRLTILDRMLGQATNILVEVNDKPWDGDQRSELNPKTPLPVLAA